MNKYQNSKIYKLVCLTTGNCYIGSTIQKLKYRFKQHKEDYLRYIDGKIHYKSSYEIIKNNNYLEILITEYPCNSKKELNIKEQSYIEGAINCVNQLAAHADARCLRERKDRYNTTARNQIVQRENCNFCNRNYLKKYMKRHLKICKENPINL